MRSKRCIAESEYVLRFVVCASLTKILVSDNELGDHGTTILCDALGKNVTNVQELDLRSNQIGSYGAKVRIFFTSVPGDRRNNRWTSNRPRS